MLMTTLYYAVKYTIKLAPAPAVGAMLELELFGPPPLPPLPTEAVVLSAKVTVVDPGV
jgi:hypothetical protein